MQRRESGVSEIISAIPAVILVIALACILGAIFSGWAVRVEKTPSIVTQATPVAVTGASVVQVFMSQGETVSLAPATGPGLPVKFSLTDGTAVHFCDSSILMICLISSLRTGSLSLIVSKRL